MDDLSDVTPPADELNDERYPSLYNISPAFFYRFIPVPVGERRRPEYVYVDEDSTGLDGLELTGAISQWNLTWEAGHFRKTMMDERFPKVLRDVIDAAGEQCDVRLVPLDEKSGRYSGYAPLYHLLPLGLLDRYGLPPLRRGVWPADVAPYSISSASRGLRGAASDCVRRSRLAVSIAGLAVAGVLCDGAGAAARS